MEPVKILVVGDARSIHTARFVALLHKINYNVRVFQSANAAHQDEQLKNTTIYLSPFALNSAMPRGGNKLISWVLPKWIKALSRLPLYPLWNRIPDQSPHGLFCRWLAPSALKGVIADWQPDIVFSLKMQCDGYVVARAQARSGGRFPTWVHFNWGTDIEYFAKFPAQATLHEPLVREILENCDYHIADCLRDVHQAFAFGLKGKSLGFCLANGGFDLALLRDIADQAKGPRNIILVKARQWLPVSHGMRIVELLESMEEQLRGYKVVLLLATPDVIQRVEHSKIDFAIPRNLPYQELLALYARARFTIAATEVDGTPSFLIESIAMGALPIHSDLSSVQEWVKDSENGLLFSMDDPDSLRRAIVRALEDDAFVEHAREVNGSVTRERLDRDLYHRHIEHLINEVILPGRAPRPEELILEQIIPSMPVDVATRGMLPS